MGESRQESRQSVGIARKHRPRPIHVPRRVVFSVDLFNEGVDVPVVDTLLLLRPVRHPGEPPVLSVGGGKRRGLARTLRLRPRRSHAHATFAPSSTS